MSGKTSSRDGSPSRPLRFGRRAGFTLMEVILVLVLVVVISGIALPYFAGSYKGAKLRSAARTIDRMARYARSMAILREQTLTLALNPDSMELFLGGATQATNRPADGKLDQGVLKRLGYVADGESAGAAAGIEKEVHRFLPDGVAVKGFEKDRTEEDDAHEALHLVRFYPNGQCDWFVLELEDGRGMAVKMENDPISGKIHVEFAQ